MKSVRARVTVTATIILGVVLALAAVVIIFLVQLQLVGDLDKATQRAVEELALEIEAGADPAAIGLPLGFSETHFVIVDSQGTVVNSTPGIEMPAIPDDLTEEELQTAIQRALEGAALETAESAWPTPSFDFGFVQVFIYEVIAPDGSEYEIHALSPFDVVDRAVGQVRVVLSVAIVTITVLFAALVWWLTGRMLRPVVELTARAEQIGTETLDERLREPGTGDEVDRLARTLNSMLARLDRGVKAQQQFVSDASHELRSPLTLILGEAELARASPSPERLLLATDKAIEHGGQMRDLISDLLELAMADEEHLNHREVDLDDVIRLASAGHGVEIDDAAVQHVRIRGDASALQRVMRNLIENAARYATSRIEVSCRAVGQQAEIIVDDDGPGVEPAFRPHIFRRFSRLDASRQRATGGTGLGLAIVAAIVDSHDGTIHVDDAPRLGGARFVVRLPLDRRTPGVG